MAEKRALCKFLRKGDAVRATRDIFEPVRGRQRHIVALGARGVVTAAGHGYAFARFGIHELEIFGDEVERV